MARDRVQETDGLFVVGEVLFPGFGHEREVDEFLIAELGHLYAQGVFGALPFERALHRGGRDGRTIGKLFVAVETRHLFDEILLDFDVEAVGGRHHREDVPFARPFKAQAREDRLHGVDGDLHADHLEAAVHAHRDGLAFGKLRDDVVDRAHLGFGRAADVENELSDVFEVRRVRAEVDAAFVAVGGVRREVELAGTPLNGDLVPEGGFDEDVLRVVRDLGLVAALDAGETFGGVAVADDAVVLVDVVAAVVKEVHRFALLGPTHRQVVGLDLVEVVEVRRTAEIER